MGVARRRRWCRRHAWLCTAVTAAAALRLAYVIVSATTGPPAPPPPSAERGELDGAESSRVLWAVAARAALAGGGASAGRDESPVVAARAPGGRVRWARLERCAWARGVGRNRYFRDVLHDAGGGRIREHPDEHPWMRAVLPAWALSPPPPRDTTVFCTADVPAKEVAAAADGPGRTASSFPGAYAVTNRKDGLCRLAERSGGATPRCWRLPEQRASLAADVEPDVPVVVKPADGWAGRGVRLERAGDVVGRARARARRHGGRVEEVAQERVRAHVLGGRRWDMRVHVLATSVEPLRLYVHRVGVARFVPANGTVTSNPEQQPAGTLLPRSAGDVLRPGAAVWELGAALAALDMQEGDGSAARAFGAVTRAVTAVLRAAAPLLGETPCAGCYQLWGVDVILDTALEAHVIDMNTAPSTDARRHLVGANAVTEVYADAWRLKGVVPRTVQVDRARLVSRAEQAGLVASRDELLRLAAGDNPELAARLERAAAAVEEDAHRGGFTRIVPAPSDAVASEAARDFFALRNGGLDGVLVPADGSRPWLTAP